MQKDVGELVHESQKVDLRMQQANETLVISQGDSVVNPVKNTSLNMVTVEFEEVVAEPEGYYSLAQVWRLTHAAFTVSQYWSYRLLTALFGIPLAILWGFLFACASFWQVWAAVPCLHCYLLELHCLATTFPVCLRGLCDPLFHAAGRLFTHVRLGLRNGASSPP
ncbi:caveolin-3-like [Narcine bancroftii]|uniref:caveolin-3-like n=1 Tax=Narcine bancroftii TaxID=1343680 RepID=UPI003831BDE1